ncbi:complement C1q tumor necrosis factor-related protein 3 [Salmo salar]|uniref:Complement C1q tumor necrosis factor-related protein 3-like n=1 Tax=Salmo salar TaxID=8030 RepID=A0A1S3LH10_SALSA|nr:complement C1q tumor necrosis factor-related protein 3-like [Salmo salar]XP_045548949.1 complement C1q tumor necrosis factor-related protein 3-like [Salmo salar]|eukprot:XP_013990107.1 PREDICTED: complement C1q tumor necrosis factor-related protein 3-like [Salmo salar]
MKTMMKKTMLPLQLIVIVCLSYGQADDSTNKHSISDYSCGPLFSHFSCLSAKVGNLRREVEDLRKSRNSVGVAFSAALRPPTQDKQGFGNTGPFQADTNLVHTHVITNVGNAFSPRTGAFTAPVNGVYYFTFTSYAWIKEANIGVALYKNHEQVVLVDEYQDKGDNEDFASNGATLQLAKGDTVSLVLPSGFQVTSNAFKNFSTFSGFLLFHVEGGQ